MNDLLIKYLRKNENIKNEILKKIEINNFYMIYIYNKKIKIEFFNNIYEFKETIFYKNFLNTNLKYLEKIKIYENEIIFSFIEYKKYNIEILYNRFIYINKNINKNDLKLILDLKNLFKKYDIDILNKNLKKIKFL